MTPTFQYPTTTSRTLDVSNKSLVTLVAMHDRMLTDADLNALQDLQSYKLQRLIADHGVTSGGLTYSPMLFNSTYSNTFLIPAFDVLFNGEVVSIQGQLSADVTLNRIQVPPPTQPGPGQEDARMYIVFLELWYQALNPITGTGYYVYTNPSNGSISNYFYPYGGILPDPTNATVYPDDSIDIFQGLFTTGRAQIQWRLNIQRVALDYDFTQGQLGFYYTGARPPGTGTPTPTPGFPVLTPTGDPGQIVYGQAGLLTTIPGISPLAGTSTYAFTSMNSVNGDTALWRCGDGNVYNSLSTMDGYSYAMPVAIVFQRNCTQFDIVNNFFGCADPNNPNSGLLITNDSGRYDSKFADQIFPADVVDTRTTVSLTGIDMDDQMRKGFGDLITGNTKLAISRGDGFGNSVEAVGSQLDYYVAVTSTPIPNVNTVGQFDGYANGFSSDLRTFYSTQVVTTAQKATGNPSNAWVQGDAFTIALPVASSNTVISSISVTAINTIGGVSTAVALLRGQLQFNGLGSTTATVVFATNLRGTAFDPGVNDLYVTVGVTYPAGSSMNLQKVPSAVQGGLLYDGTSKKTMPVFGISEYQVSAFQPSLVANAVQSYNPEYSDLILGTWVWILSSSSVVTLVNVTTISGVSYTTFTINCKGLNAELSGFYAVVAQSVPTDGSQPQAYTVTARSMQSLPSNGGIQHIITLFGAVTTTVAFAFLASNTAQVAYNAPVKGIVQIEETVLFGTFTGDSNFVIDPRVAVESVYYNATTDVNTIILGASGCTIKGIAGDNVNRFIWVYNLGTKTFYPQIITSAIFGNGVVTITVPGNGGTTVFSISTPFLFCGSILPALSKTSSLIVETQYTPYQGEGVLNRTYEILHSEDTALITTNGTGAAPVIGITDVHPYNRELPISTTLPCQLSQYDATLTNSPIATMFDSNYVAMQQGGVEHTFAVPLHTNDFIPPVNKDTRKVVQFTAAAVGGRGFAKAIPHLGFAITPPTPQISLGEAVQTTTSPIMLYVDNVNGNDNNNGFSLASATKSIAAALAQLPPVLRHPCTIFLHSTNTPFTLSNNLDVVALGDGVIRDAKIYTLGNLSRVMQDEGRLVITREAGVTNTIVIDASNFLGFGDGQTTAFYIENSRVIFNGIQFNNFLNTSVSSAITAYSSDLDFVDCVWLNNLQAGAYVGCDSIILDGGSTTMTLGSTGHKFVQSNFVSSGHNLLVSSVGVPYGPFYFCTQNSTMTLTQHSTGTLNETNVSAGTVVATAQQNSNIYVDSTFQTNGEAVLSANSVLVYAVGTMPFLGGVTNDASSSQSVHS